MLNFNFDSTHKLRGRLCFGHWRFGPFSFCFASNWTKIKLDENIPQTQLATKPPELRQFWGLGVLICGDFSLIHFAKLDKISMTIYCLSDKNVCSPWYISVWISMRCFPISPFSWCVVRPFWWFNWFYLNISSPYVPCTTVCHLKTCDIIFSQIFGGCNLWLNSVKIVFSQV